MTQCIDIAAVALALTELIEGEWCIYQWYPAKRALSAMRKHGR